jgi:hypothetical protein
MSIPGRFDPLVHLYMANGWRDVSDSVRYDDGKGISIKRSAQDQGTALNTTANFLLGNQTGNFAPRNAAGTWFSYFKRNTPCRVASRLGHDLYVSRSTSNGWGTVTDGVPTRWTWSTTGGAAGDYAVTAGVATHSLSSTASRITYLGSVDMSNIETRVTFQLPFANVTGDSIALSLLFRGSGTTTFYRALITITAAEAVTVQWYDTTVAPLGSPVTVAGLTNTGQQISVAAHMDGETGRIKVWPAASPEPFRWTLEQDDIGTALATPLHGWVGIESFKTAGNTNGTFSISYTNWEVLSWRHHGNLSSVPPVRDISGRDSTTPVTSSPPTRRQRSKGKVLRSPAFRALSKAAHLVAYWSCEDGDKAQFFASSNATWPSMDFVTGTPQLATNSLFAASAPGPIVAKSIWEGLVMPYTPPSPNVINLRWLMYIDISNAEPPNNSTIIRLKNEGTAYFYILRYQTGGQLLLEVQDYFGTVIDSDTIAVETRWVGARGALQLVQSGANVNWSVSIADVDQQTSNTITGATAGRTIGMLGGVAVGDGGIDNVLISHITAQTVVSDPLDYSKELYAWQSERAPARSKRVLRDEEGIAYQYEGALTAGLGMGVQPIASVSDILDETVAADQGILFDPVFRSAVGYISYGALAGRTPRLSLSYTGNQLHETLPVADDDKYTANSIVLTMGNTSSSEASKITRTATTGPLSSLEPEDGGVGLYEKPVTANIFTYDEADQLTGWLLMKGTTDRPYLPTITGKLASDKYYGSVSQFQAAMDTREGSFINVTHIPTTLATDDILSVTLGLTERLTQAEHDITWYTMPGDVYQPATLDDPGFRMGAEANYLNTNLGSATPGSTGSMSVKSLDGALFTTDPAEFPFDVWLGGERMTISAISGATSPQTFTISVRGVNGVAPAHTADDSPLARVTPVSARATALY